MNTSSWNVEFLYIKEFPWAVLNLKKVFRLIWGKKSNTCHLYHCQLLICHGYDNNKPVFRLEPTDCSASCCRRIFVTNKTNWKFWLRYITRLEEEIIQRKILQMKNRLRICEEGTFDFCFTLVKSLTIQ